LITELNYFIVNVLALALCFDIGFHSSSKDLTTFEFSDDLQDPVVQIYAVLDINFQIISLLNTNTPIPKKMKKRKNKKQK